MSSVTLYGFGPSTYTQTVRLLCHELGLDYTLEGLDIGSESHKNLHPFLKMPVLKSGETPIFESMAICLYLCEQNGQRLIPGKAHNRHLMFSWISATIDYYYPALVSACLEKCFDAEKGVEYLALLEKQLQASPYLAGPEISLADLYLLPVVLFLERQSPCEEEGDLPFPSLDKWMRALESREGWATILAGK